MKLNFKKLGLFKILKQVRKVNFKLQLPKKSQLHPIFHVLLLELIKEIIFLIINEEF